MKQIQGIQLSKIRLKKVNLTRI